MSDKKNKAGATVVAGTAATAAGAAALSNKKSPRQQRSAELRKKEKKRVQDRKNKTVSMRNEANTTIAKDKLDRLKNIKPSNLSDRDKLARKALIQEQKSVIKGAAKSTAKDIAKRVGLRAVPVVGAFLSAFESTPAYRRGGYRKK